MTGSGHLHAAVRGYRAELVKLRRPGTMAAVGGLAALAVLSTVLSFALADDTAQPMGTPAGLLPTLPALAGPAGLTLGFRAGSTFTGLLLFILCAVTITGEYSQGTIRMIFMREPRRTGWLAGRTGAILTLVAVALVGAFVLSAATAVVMAGLRGVDTGQWWTLDAVQKAASGYLNVLVAAFFFMIAGTALGILTRSTTVALMIGVAWTVPLEHIVQGSWLDATRVLPGLVFDTIGAGGRPDASFGPALLVGIGYAAVFALAGATSLARRDVTA
jgi:ABC-2 type transport system permease protein